MDQRLLAPLLLLLGAAALGGAYVVKEVPPPLPAPLISSEMQASSSIPGIFGPGTTSPTSSGAAPATGD